MKVMMKSGNVFDDDRDRGNSHTAAYDAEHSVLDRKHDALACSLKFTSTRTAFNPSIY